MFAPRFSTKSHENNFIAYKSNGHTPKGLLRPSLPTRSVIPKSIFDEDRPQLLYVLPCKMNTYGQGRLKRLRLKFIPNFMGLLLASPIASPQSHFAHFGTLSPKGMLVSTI